MTDVVLLPTQKYIDLKDLAKLLKITTRQGIYYMIRRNNFPKPKRTFRGKSYWDIEEVETYCNAFGESIKKEFTINECKQ